MALYILHETHKIKTSSLHLKQLFSRTCKLVHLLAALANSSFLGTFTELQKATISFFMYVCMSVRPYGKPRLPLDGIS